MGEKGEIMANNTKGIEYQLTKKMYKAILDTKEDPAEEPRKYVMKVINEEFGLRGTVKQLHILEEGF